MEVPSLVERIIEPNIPEASELARIVVSDAQSTQLMEAETMGMDVNTEDFIIFVGVSIMARTQDLLNGEYPLDYKNYGLAFVRETDGLCDLIEHGRRWTRLLEKDGFEVEPGQVSLDIVDQISVALFKSIRGVYGVTSRRQVRKLTNLLRVPPAEKAYIGNRI